jgi:VCBS repeat-containing protein
MSSKFRQYIRRVFLNKEKASAITKLEEKLKAEKKARAIAEEKLKVEIATKTAAEQKAKAQAEQRLVTQYRRYSALASRVETQAKEEIAKVKVQLKETLEKLNSSKAQIKQKEKKLNEVQEKLKNETDAKAKVLESLKAEKDEHRKIEAKVKEEIAKAKAQIQERVQSYATESNRSEEKFAKDKKSRNVRTIITGITEEDSKDKGKKSLDVRPPETINALLRICRNVFHPQSRKTKVALFSALAILSAIAITFGVSVVNRPPVAKPDIVTTQEDESVLITLMEGDSDREHFTYNIVKGPSQGTLSGKAPEMTYTPASNYHGQDNFTYSINEAKADKNQATISITVLAANDAPTAYHRTETIKVNKSLTATLTGTDVDGDPLKFVISKEPQYGKLTLNSYFDKTGKFIYTPDPDFEGQDSFTFKMNDGRLDSAPATVSINVAPNLLPVAKSHSLTIPEDTPAQIALIGNDPDSDPLSYIIVSEPTNGKLNGTAPNLTYTPNENFNGTDSFSFKVNDGTDDSKPATISITVSSVNDPPVANSDSIVTTEDTPAVKIDVLANDTDIDNEGRYLYLDTFSVTAVTQGKNGTVIINPDGTLNYSPNANFHGSDEFTYTISDNKGDSDTAKVNVTITNVNDPPTITSAPVTTANVGVLYIYDVNATDPDLTDTLTYSLNIQPIYMTIDTNTGLIQWKPIQEGEIEVAVMVADSNSTPTTDTQSFTITVNPPPPKIAKISPRDGYYQRTRKTLSADGKTQLVRSSDDSRFVTSYGSYTSFDFSYVTVPNDVMIKSVIVYIEHYEDERFTSGKLEWAVGTGWPKKPVVWASLKAPLHEQKSYESVDSWDITSLIDSREKLNSLQLQIKNSDLVGRKQTMIDYIYLVVEWE